MTPEEIPPRADLDTLVADLTRALRPRISADLDRLDLPALEAVAAQLNDEHGASKAHQIQHSVGLAIKQLGEGSPSQQAAQQLYRLAPGSENTSLTERRDRAIQAFPSSTGGAESFRKSREPRLLRMIAHHLLTLATEHRPVADAVDAQADAPVETPAPGQALPSTPSEVAPDARGGADTTAESGSGEAEADDPNPVDEEPPPAPSGAQADESTRRSEPESERTLGRGRTIRKPLLVVPGGLALTLAILAAVAAVFSLWPFGNNPVTTDGPSSASASTSAELMTGRCPGHQAHTMRTTSIHDAIGPQLRLTQATDYKHWSRTLAPVAPGTIIHYLISYNNTTTHVDNQVALRASLPPNMDVVPNSTCLYDSSHQRGLRISSNSITKGGVAIGNFGREANAYVSFAAAAPGKDILTCGATDLTTRAYLTVSGKQRAQTYGQTVVVRRC